MYPGAPHSTEFWANMLPSITTFSILLYYILLILPFFEKRSMLILPFTSITEFVDDYIFRKQIYYDIHILVNWHRRQEIGYCRNKFYFYNLLDFELQEGMGITVLRDPQNAKDPHAVKVLYAGSDCGQMLGYVPRELAKVLAPLLDTHFIQCECYRNFPYQFRFGRARQHTANREQELCSSSVICVITLLEIYFFAFAKKGSDAWRASKYQVANTFVALDLAMEG